MSKRRAPEEFSLSFLDVICCGFGAIILLLIITRISEPIVLEESTRDLESRIAALQEQLHRLRGDSVVLNRDLTTKQEQLSDVIGKVARLERELSSIKGEFAASDTDAVPAKPSSPMTSPKMTSIRWIRATRHRWWLGWPAIRPPM